VFTADHLWERFRVAAESYLGTDYVVTLAEARVVVRLVYRRQLERDPEPDEETHLATEFLELVRQTRAGMMQPDAT